MALRRHLIIVSDAWRTVLLQDRETHPVNATAGHCLSWLIARVSLRCGHAQITNDPASAVSRQSEARRTLAQAADRPSLQQRTVRSIPRDTSTFTARIHIKFTDLAGCPKQPACRESQRSPADANPVRPISCSTGSNQSSPHTDHPPEYCSQSVHPLGRQTRRRALFVSETRQT